MLVVGCRSEKLPADFSPDVFRIQPTADDLNSFLDCLHSEGITLISAHRGGKPENTIEGMSATLATMPALIEVDVATSADGVLFLMHDDTLGRTTNGSGIVADKAWSQIENLEIDIQNI